MVVKCGSGIPNLSSRDDAVDQRNGAGFFHYANPHWLGCSFGALCSLAHFPFLSRMLLHFASSWLLYHEPWTGLRGGLPYGRIAVFSPSSSGTPLAAPIPQKKYTTKRCCATSRTSARSGALPIRFGGDAQAGHPNRQRTTII